jgi:hypothetical protein
MLKEAGVHYTHNHRSADDLRMIGVKFKRLHVPTGDVSDDTVFVFLAEHAIVLMNHWNNKSDDWKYWVPEDQTSKTEYVPDTVLGRHKCGW